MFSSSSASGPSHFSQKDHFIQWLATNSPSNDWVADIRNTYISLRTHQDAFVKAIFERVGDDFSKLNSADNQVFLANWLYYRKTKAIGAASHSAVLPLLENTTPKEALETLFNFKEMDEAKPSPPTVKSSFMTRLAHSFSQLLNPDKPSKADLSLVKANLPSYIDLWVNRNKIPPKSLGIDNEEKAKFFITNYGKHVHHVDLREFGSLIYDITIEKVIEYCPEIHSILISSHNITNESAFAIANNCPHLTHLDLSGCRQITNEAILSIRGKCLNLKHLTFFLPHE